MRVGSDSMHRVERERSTASKEVCRAGHDCRIVPWAQGYGYGYHSEVPSDWLRRPSERTRRISIRRSGDLQIFSSLNPLTSTLPVPFFVHSASASSSGSSLIAFRPTFLPLNFPPGITIFPAPAVFPPTTCARGLGNPSALRCLRVNGFSGGGGLGEGEDKGDSEDSDENPEGESPGVSASGSTMLTSASISLSSSSSCASGGATSCDKRERDGFRLRARLEAVSEVSELEDAEDSSNVRLGDLYGRGSRSELILGIIGYGGGVVREDDEEGSGEPAGEGERERGRGISAGAGGGGVGEVAAIITGFGAGLRSLRLVEVVALGGCLEVGFCLSF